MSIAVLGLSSTSHSSSHFWSTFSDDFARPTKFLAGRLADRLGA